MDANTDYQTELERGRQIPRYHIRGIENLTQMNLYTMRQKQNRVHREQTPGCRGEMGGRGLD